MLAVSSTQARSSPSFVSLSTCSLCQCASSSTCLFRRRRLARPHPPMIGEPALSLFAVLDSTEALSSSKSIDEEDSAREKDIPAAPFSTPAFSTPGTCQSSSQTWMSRGYAIGGPGPKIYPRPLLSIGRPRRRPRRQSHLSPTALEVQPDDSSHDAVRWQRCKPFQVDFCAAADLIPSTATERCPSSGLVVRCTGTVFQELPTNALVGHDTDRNTHTHTHTHIYIYIYTSITLHSLTWIQTTFFQEEGREAGGCYTTPSYTHPSPRALQLI